MPLRRAAFGHTFVWIKNKSVYKALVFNNHAVTLA
jgi:hypothetical protein